MTTSSIFLEQVWDGILSRDQERIIHAYASLDTKSQETVICHLKHMVSEEGWHPEQVKSAQVALQAILKR